MEVFGDLESQAEARHRLRPGIARPGIASDVTTTRPPHTTAVVAPIPKVVGVSLENNPEAGTLSKTPAKKV
jgi:hypothetical protein